MSAYASLSRLAALAGCLILLASAITMAPALAPALWAAGDAALRRDLAGLIQRGGVAVGKAGEAGEAPAVSFSHGRGAYIPASIIKLATALAAFHVLGPDFRFPTEFFLDQRRNLIVRGYGDPFLVSEEWAAIGQELAAKGVFDKPLNALILDDSAFSGKLEVDGAADSENPYDARLGALVSNFNTIFVEIGPGGKPSSAEPQTPLTPLAVKLAAGLPPGRHRINFSRTPGHSLRYTGELASAILQRAGARISGKIEAGRPPRGLKPILVHRASRPLTQVVKSMMEFSNNFIANQIVLALSLKRSGAPAGLSSGIAALSAYLREEIGMKGGEFSLVEGSGLSPNNRITLRGMLRIVEAFRPWRHLLRSYGKPPRQYLAKTGTLTGVYTLAGFLPATGGRERPFVIMLNQPRNTRARILRRLQRHFGR